MTLSYTYDGVAITHDIAPSSINIPTRADMGEAAFGGIPIEDPEKTLAIVGHKPFIVEESACSQPRLFTGWTTQRDIGRSEEEGMFVGPDPSLADMTVADLNILFGMRIIRGGGTGNGKRPSETWDQRLAWIMGDDTLDGLIEITNEDWVISRSLVMDEADYRGQPPSAVFDDLLQRPPIRQLTYFAAWDPDVEAVGLFFHELGEATNDSTLSISNDPADVDETTCFAPWMDSKLARKPDQVYSEVLVEWPGGRTFRSRQSTEDAYGRRGTQINRPYCKSRARAQEYGDAFLDRHDREEDVITTQILVPKASAGLVMAGQRISCKFTHLDGYEDWTSLRVTECKPTPATDIGDLYLISLELVAPKAGTSPGGCPDPTPSDVWYPFGSATSDADGNVMYVTSSAGNYLPTPGNVGAWNFPVYGAGGIGTVDRAGDCANNGLRIAISGAGTLTVVTVAGVGHACPLVVRRWTVQDNTNRDDETVDQYGEAGDTFTIIAPESPDCDWVYEVADYNPALLDPPGPAHTCGTNWGWSSVTWTAGEVDEEEDVDPQFPDPVVSTSDPTADDDAEDGYLVGQLWINSTLGYTYILVDNTAGAAVWTLITTGTPTWNFVTSDGTTTVDPTVELTFVGPTLTDLGAGVAELTFAATPDAATTVEDETTWGITPAVGSDTEYARQDHTHGSPADPVSGSAIAALGFVGQLLISDSPSTPLVFADILQTEDEDDLLYADL